MRILQEADGIIDPTRHTQDEKRKYGPFTEGMERAAMIMRGATGKDITAEDMYMALVALKLSRESYHHKRDNLMDAAAYIGGLQDYIDKRYMKAEKSK